MREGSSLHVYTGQGGVFSLRFKFLFHRHESLETRYAICSAYAHISKSTSIPPFSIVYKTFLFFKNKKFHPFEIVEVYFYKNLLKGITHASQFHGIRCQLKLYCSCFKPIELDLHLTGGDGDHELPSKEEIGKLVKDYENRSRVHSIPQKKVIQCEMKMNQHVLSLSPSPSS
ncbi:hypothetical protein HMI56_006735 [Coelomomyces lativittatus]|nr:hypothetical protein HMI56_006735 [Coelomomyces lativittatus]